jgi:predicted dehydrogenase
VLQVSQNYRTGTVEVTEVPPPALRPGGVLVQTRASLISSGTERGKVALARKSLLGKAKERPEAVHQVLQTLRREGLAATYRKVLNRLDRLSSIGYSAAGVVTAVGHGVTRYLVGDRVSVGGAGYANHAEVLWVPVNLAARMPDDVGFDEAAFATVASIALHAVRLASPSIGDQVAVIGLGLIGQLVARLARIAGCRVTACDLNERRMALARAHGAEATVPGGLPALVRQSSGGIGTDVAIVAAASHGSGPIKLAAEVCGDRGRVVVIGATGLEVPRELFYRKELALVVSRSYGPGRYDSGYEEKGIDYPVSYVRWTEGRNLGAILTLLAERRLEVSDLISLRLPLTDALQAYEALLDPQRDLLGVILEYPEREREVAPPSPRAVAASMTTAKRAMVGVGLIGIGNFASNVLVPALKRTGRAELVSVCSASGLSARDAVRRHGFARAVVDADAVITDPAVAAVVIATPHYLHADLALAALAAGKAVFVEKPLAIDWEQFGRLCDGVPEGLPLLVGFNRRFSPHLQAARQRLGERRGAALVTIRVNAGAIPIDSPLHDPAIGGGRLVGEGCHFIDLAAALVDLRPSSVTATAVHGADADSQLLDNVTLMLEFSDGSIASVVYTSKGDGALSKERIEVFCDGWCAVVDDFNRSELISDGRVFRRRSRGAKGHAEEIAGFVNAVADGKPMPIPVAALLASTAATLAARDSALAGGAKVDLLG